jgi:glutathione S-transferase
MYSLYFSPGSASMAPHAVLEEIGAPYTLKQVDISRDKPRDPEYLKLNPHGRVPTLVVDGKQSIYEAAAICMYLADRHPNADLAPAISDPRRGLYYQWLAYLTNTLQAEYLLYYYPERNTTNAAHAPEVKAKALEQLVAIWDHIDRALAKRSYLLGDKLSACDLYLHMLYSWREPPMQLESGGRNVQRCTDLVAARPAVKRMLQQNEAA